MTCVLQKRPVDPIWRHKVTTPPGRLAKLTERAIREETRSVGLADVRDFEPNLRYAMDILDMVAAFMRLQLSDMLYQEIRRAPERTRPVCPSSNLIAGDVSLVLIAGCVVTFEFIFFSLLALADSGRA